MWSHTSTSSYASTPWCLVEHYRPIHIYICTCTTVHRHLNAVTMHAQRHYFPDEAHNHSLLTLRELWKKKSKRETKQGLGPQQRKQSKADFSALPLHICDNIKAAHFFILYDTKMFPRWTERVATESLSLSIVMSILTAEMAHMTLLAKQSDIRTLYSGFETHSEHEWLPATFVLVYKWRRHFNF